MAGRRRAGLAATIALHRPHEAAGDLCLRIAAKSPGATWVSSASTAAANFALRAQGILAVVCPVSDDSDLCGVGVFTVGPDEVAAIMEEDPGVQAGIFSYEVHASRSFPGDSLPA